MLFKENALCQFLFRLVLLGIAVGAFVLSFLGLKPIALFYTNWSVWFAVLASLAAFVASALFLFKGDKRILTNKIYLAVKFSAAIMIFATFVVSAFVLPDKIWTAGYWTIGSIFKHFLLPIVFIADLLLCDEVASYKMSFPFFALIAPLAYWAILIVRFLIARGNFGGAIPEAEWGNYYPYGFTNIDKSASLGGLIGLLAGILVGLIAIGFLFYFLNKKIGAKKQ